ncbi:hypothetical protein BDQ12DRAFT_193251 [Crucibulum laeve]|uniref:Homeodomain-like protein n=1 Tax=Crucibulum laeve TaxID=68775 RepID=A0A5C3MR38_9AGAR|nr:hypothetical protein BDQ12DRAFT_193251 [Crucibulum laeve]
MLSVATSASIHDATVNHDIVNPGDISSHIQDHEHSKKKKKKKKRARDEASDEQSSVKEKKKRKVREPDEQQPPEEQAIPAPSVEATIPDTDAPPKKKKSKKKDKGKERATRDSGVTQVDPNAQANALLSAIVAAAAGTLDAPMPNPQIPPPFHPDMLAHPGQPTYMPYPPMGYGYGAPPPFMVGSPQGPSLFPTPAGLPFSELTFGSNEDVLRALQDLDYSKIAHALKALGDAQGNASGVPPFGVPPPGFIAPPQEQTPVTPLGQVPAASNAILGIPPKEPSAPSHHRRTIDMSLPGNEQHTSPDHANMLANKWLSANKLAELVKTEGLIYKKGKFSAIEEQQLKAAMESYRIGRGFTEDQMQEVIFPKNEKNRDNAFWSELTAAVPQRPIIAVYHHIRRAYHHMKPKGPWTPDEDVLLKQAVADLGTRWEQVSERVGRRSADCRDRYRNHIHEREFRLTGPWSQEEEDRLTQIVTDMTVKQGKDSDNDVFWGRVSELMGGTRGRQQCRIKWTDALSKTVKNEGQKPRWSQQDGYILVHKVDSLNVRDDTEIDWKTISDPDWNLWSAHTLQRRWLTMKRSVKGFEDMTHQEIMDILRVKKAHLPAVPPPTTRKRKERKVTSAAAINEAGESVATASTGEAGSSTARSTTHAPASGTDSDDSTDSDDE